MSGYHPEFRLGHLTGAVFLLATGLAGGLIARALGAPLPFLIGALIATAATVTFLGPRLPFELNFPQQVRSGFVCVIGVMIGGAFETSIFANWTALIPSALAVVAFVLSAFGANYYIYRRLAGYDRVEAFCSSLPGGLLESIAMAEQAGADVRLVTAQQFLRITIVVTLVPIAFSIWHGGPMGSAAGMRFETTSPDTYDWLILTGSGIAGFLLGRALRIPAYMIVGPMVVSAFVHAIGWTDSGPPDWLIATAQLVIGVGLGIRFKGLSGAMFRKVLKFGLLSTAVMLLIGISLSLLLTLVTETALPVFILSFAAGGLIEMGLIALSLQANPVFVTMHHVFRILTTVVVASTLFRRISRDRTR